MDLISLGFALIIVGFLITFLAIMLLLFKGLKEGKAEGGGVVIIGPIPIVFGTSQKIAGWLIVLAIVLVILTFLLTFWVRPYG